MTTGGETPTVQLPDEVRHAIWRIFGNGLAPLETTDVVRTSRTDNR